MDANAVLAIAVALAVGLLIGSERERSQHGPLTGGVRTFALAAVAGCVASLLGVLALVGVVVAVALIVTVGYLRRAEPDAGATTEVALVLTVVIGGAAARRPALAAAVGVAAAVILVSKDRLHRFVRQTVTEVEVSDALKFFVVAVIVLPLIPHANLGPYGAIDPRRIWTLVVLVTGLSWVGYLAVRILGPKRGLPVAGLAGGFVSGAATTAAMARHASAAEIRRPALAGAMMASVATLVQLMIVTAIADIRVTKLLWPACIAGCVVLLIEAFILAARQPQSTGETPQGRPFAFVPALILAAVLSVLLVVARWAEDQFGSAGSLAAISAAGLADAHAGALTAATLSSGSVLTVKVAAIAALSAVAVNTVVKMVLAWTSGGARVARTYALLMVPPVLVVAGFAMLTAR